MSGGYASGTSVQVDRSVAEIRALLARAGSTHFAFGETPEVGMVQFALKGLHYRFEVRRPTAEEAKAGRMRDPHHIRVGDEMEAEWRRRWRARVLWLKAQIEFAEGEPDVMAQAMMASLVLPDGQTFARWAVPQIESMYADGAMPPLLGGGR